MRIIERLRGNLAAGKSRLTSTTSPLRFSRRGLRISFTRRPLYRPIDFVVIAAVLPVLFYLLVYPALFPNDVEQPVLETDPAEGKVWLDSQLVFEFRGSYSTEEIIDSLQFDPPVNIDPAQIVVEQEAQLPWHKGLPWAVTRVTINPGREPVFRQDTEYTVTVSGQSLDFETITIPEVVKSVVEADTDANGADVPTNTRVLLHFNEEIVWHDEYLDVNPPVAVQTATSLDAEGNTVLAVSPLTRFENSTNYRITVQPGVRDVHDHAGGESYSVSFGTWAPPHITWFTPAGVTQPVDVPISIEFERPVRRESAAFSVTPAITGHFEWESDTVLRIRPAGPLPYSTAYETSIAATALGGDPYAPQQWSFRTQDPPIGLEILGDLTGPTILEARAFGGLGAFDYQWSTGSTGPQALVNVPHGQTLPVELRVTSGDQVNVQTVQVSGPPYPTDYVAVPCPAGWALVRVGICYLEQSEGPGGNDVFVARIDTRDPELEVSTALTGDYLGAAAPLSQAASAHGALVATNADFFHHAPKGATPVGPLVSNGSIVQLDRRSDASFTITQGGQTFASGPSQGYLTLNGAAGAATVWNVNTLPDEGELAIFNDYWAPTLSLPFEACYATFAFARADLLEAVNHYCGPVSEVPLVAGHIVVVARGSAIPWLEASVPAQIAIGDPLGLTSVELLVGGSHALLQGGAVLPVSGAHLDRAPRTAIGTDANGFLYLIVVDGRRGDSPGMILPELQSFLVGLGVTEAINLDGGGSSEMFLFNQVRNRLSDGRERHIPSIIEVGPPRTECGAALVRC